MTKKTLLTALLILSVSLVSCGKNSPDEKKPANDNKPTVEQKNDSDKKEDNKKQETKTDNQNNKNDNKNSNETTNKIDSLSIYSIDENTLEPNKASDLNVDSNISLNDKLQKVANTVSQNYFGNLPIKIKSIDNINGKKIATINLSDGNGSTWTDKFQGSAGGQMTSNTLIENFLQVSYKGEWVDGVKFLYNDAPIEYDHVYELSEIQYRH